MVVLKALAKTKLRPARSTYCCRTIISVAVLYLLNMKPFILPLSLDHTESQNKLVLSYASFSERRKRKGMQIIITKPAYSYLCEKAEELHLIWLENFLPLRTLIKGG